ITYSTNGLTGPFNPVDEDNDPGTANTGLVTNGAGAGGPGAEHTFTWTVPDEASANVIIRVADARDGTSPVGDQTDIIGESQSFEIIGYIITHAPVADEKWAVASSHDITWEWGGTMPQVKITISQNGVGGPFVPIDEDNDPGTANTGIVTNGVYDPQNPGATHSFTWIVEDYISPTCVIKVADARTLLESIVNDDSGEFKIQGDFTLTSPAIALKEGGDPAEVLDYECRWVTNEVREVTWTTFGTIPKVDIYYSKDNFADIDPADGVPDNQILIKNDLGQQALDWDNTGTFDWKIANDRSDTVKIRIYDHNDPDVFIEGPYVDPGFPAGVSTTMKIDYYTITWDIRDLITNQHINGLTVSEVSTSGWPGWDATGVSSPKNHDVTADNWTATFTHKDYGPIEVTYFTGVDEEGKVWGDRKIFRTMETLVVHIWRAYSEFSYDVETDRLDITSWLERDGSLVPGALVVDVKIYDGFEQIKRKTILVQEEDTPQAGDPEKHYFYEDIPSTVDIWLGTSWDPDLEQEVERFQFENIADCATYKTGEIQTPIDFAGFFPQTWTPTSHTSGGTAYDTLQAGKVYTVKTYIVLGTGGNFTTPVSFTVTIPTAMASMEDSLENMDDKIDYVLDKPMSVISGEIQASMDQQIILLDQKTDEVVDIVSAQTETIETKMNEQSALIDSKTDEMIAMVDMTLTSFETRTQSAIEDLQEGADMAVEAGETLMETALKYSWGASVSPNPVLTNETVTINCQGQPGLAPVIDIYDVNSNLVYSSIMKESSDGVYVYEFEADDSFEAGKAYSFIIQESETGGLVTGSGMVGKYEWSVAVFPDPALTGDTITLQCIGLPNLLPQVYIYAWDGDAIEEGLLMTQDTPGMYIAKVEADGNFPAGKAYTYMVTEQQTGTVLVGSGMVESMSITTVAGLAAAAPEASRAAKKALEAIKALEAVLISGDSINIALTLKNLKSSVDALPEIMSKEGPTAVITNAINEVSDRIKALAGEEGYDMGTILEEALTESPTVKEIRNKTDAINGTVDVVLQTFESKIGGIEDPIVLMQ
ncbi:MAG: hypothetical protein KJ952_03120, partial [Candidatus Omnitrophica bacterium]|nr:hypothetical protein [Candidatus Omnitrophota bacterium]